MRQALLQEHREEEIAEQQSNHRSSSCRNNSSFFPLLPSTSSTTSQQTYSPNTTNEENNDSESCTAIMGSLVQCFLRSCFNEQEEDIQHNNSMISCDQHQFSEQILSSIPFPASPQNMQLQRDVSNNDEVLVENAVTSGTRNGNDHAVSNPTTSSSQDDGISNESASPSAELVRSGENTSSSNVDNQEEQNEDSRDANSNNPPLGIGIMAFFRHLREAHGNQGTTNTTTCASSTIKKPKKGVIYSPLRTAKDFSQRKSDVDIPTLAEDEVVMPGSELQKKMSEKLKEMGYCAESEEDECLMCMEGFDESNPRMPTLCGCGVNKTYFHLPCLLNYVQQNPCCPVCNEKITWEEF